VIACIEEPALIARILGHVQQRLESDNKLVLEPLNFIARPADLMGWWRQDFIGVS